MSSTLTYTGTLIVQECYRCGIAFAIPQGLNTEALRNHSVNFYCPLGHAQHYIGQTEAERLQMRLENERTRADYWRKEQDRTERRRRAAVGQVTKIKRRVGKGVCPCCNRSFPQLTTHMETEHPNYAEAEK